MPKGKPTHEQAELMLRLYDLRREARMRQARDWFVHHFAPKSMQEMQRLVPPGSDENAYLRMVTSYWEMVCAYLNHGLIHEELFFETSGEQYLVWVRIQPILADIRKQFSKYSFAHSEKAAQRFEKWEEKREPGRVKRMREFFSTPPMKQQ